MMAFQPIGTNIERTLGTLSFGYMMFLFDLLCGLVHLFISTIAFYNPFYSYPGFMYECGVGLSGVIFALLVVHTQNSDGGNRSIFGFFTVSSALYPWVLLIVLQFIMPGVSFLGHLSGILVGYLYVYGMLVLFLPSPSTLNKIESARILGWLVTRDGYITNPNLGANLNPYMAVSPLVSGSLSSYLPTWRPSSLLPTTSTNQQGTFPGSGQRLGN